MKLADVELIPGTIIKVDDPSRLGRVKAKVPQVFESDNGEEELPWIFPLSMSHANTFHAPQVGDKIWLLRQIKYPTEYWFIPFFHMDPATQSLTESDYEDTEVILNRTTKKSHPAQIYYSNNSGTVISSSQGKMQINPEGTISINNPQGKEVNLKEEVIEIGDKSGSYEPCVLGDKLHATLDELRQDIEQLASAAQTEIFTQHITAGLRDMAAHLLNNISTILSSNIKVN